MLIYDGDGDLIDRRGDVNLNRWLVNEPSPLSSSLLFDSSVFASAGRPSTSSARYTLTRPFFFPLYLVLFLSIWIVIVRIFGFSLGRCLAKLLPSTSPRLPPQKGFRVHVGQCCQLSQS